MGEDDLLATDEILDNLQESAWRQMYPLAEGYEYTGNKCQMPGCPCGGEGRAVRNVTYETAWN